MKLFYKQTWASIYIAMRKIAHSFLFIFPRVFKNIFLGKAPMKRTDYFGKTVLFPLLETFHYQTYHILILAKFMELRGAKVYILVCDSALSGCEIRSIKNDSGKITCAGCRFSQSTILPLFKLNTLKLSSLLSEQPIDQERSSDDIGNCLNDSVIRYYFGSVPSGALEEGRVVTSHKKTAKDMAWVARLVDKKLQPDVVISNMTSYSMWEPLFRYFNKNGNRYKTISMSQYDFEKITVNQFELFTSSKRFKSYFENRPRKELSESENAELQKFLSERVKGKTPIFKELNYFEENKSFKRANLGFDRTKKNIFLFTNIYWDVGLSENALLFSGVIDWVLETIKIASHLENTDIYIKLHPGEVFDSQKSLKSLDEIAIEHCTTLPSNVKFIRPEEKISPYSLVEKMDLAVVFTGTLALELMHLGVPVVTVGRTSHFGLGLCSEPGSIEQYADILSGLKKPIATEKSQLDVFTYFYFIKSKYPWTISKKAYADKNLDINFRSLNQLLAINEKYFVNLCDFLIEHNNIKIDNW